jgi:hypothetical protein
LRVFTPEETIFTAIEIEEIEAHFPLASCRNFDQVAADGEAVDGAAEHYAADQIKHEIRPPPTGRRTNLRRQVLGPDDELLRDSMDRRIGGRRTLVCADDTGAKACGDLSGRATDAAPGTDQHYGLTVFKTGRFNAAPRS